MSEEIEISRLIADLMRHPNEALSENTDASIIDRLAEIGAPAVHPILAALSGPWPPGQHPIDGVPSVIRRLRKSNARAEESPAYFFAACNNLCNSSAASSNLFEVNRYPISKPSSSATSSTPNPCAVE